MYLLYFDKCSSPSYYTRHIFFKQQIESINKSALNQKLIFTVSSRFSKQRISPSRLCSARIVFGLSFYYYYYYIKSSSISVMNRVS
jgi:hypothetical protein